MDLESIFFGQLLLMGPSFKVRSLGPNWPNYCTGQHIPRIQQNKFCFPVSGNKTRQNKTHSQFPKLPNSESGTHGLILPQFSNEWNSEENQTKSSNVHSEIQA